MENMKRGRHKNRKKDETMGNKKRLVMIVTISFMLILSGCGNASTDNSKSEPVSSQEQIVNVAPEEEKKPIEEYEIKYSSGEFTVEDYKALADLYAKEGMVKKQRDLLEQCYRLYDDKDCLELLKAIAVNITEESNTIKTEAERLLTNLNTPEYLDDAVGMLLSVDWQSTMMPKLREGSRRYYMTDEGGKLELCFEVGYDEVGKEYSNAWYMADDGSMRCIMRSIDSIQMLVTQVVDGRYQGDFESWLCMAESGDVYHERGTFEKGICTGAYTAQVKYGNNATDLFALWSNREDMDMTEYTGDFGDEGITSVTQPADGQKNVINGGNGEDKFIVYAYTADKNGYLFINAPEGTEVNSFVFDYSVFGLESYPEITLYEPQTEANSAGRQGKTVDSKDVKVRVYDSNIEWFDGNRWHVLGDVTEYMKEDPFGAYEQESAAADGETEETKGAKAEVYQKRGAGIIKKASPVNKPKPAKAAGSKPTAPEASAGTAAPVTPQQPTAPVPRTDNSGSGENSDGSSQNNGGGSQNPRGGNQNNNSGGQSNGGSGGDSQNSGGGNSGGGSDSGGDSNSGDVDIEWTDDIL
ncbi:MAG: hypothetical protein GX235_04510 [Clostridiales bacterium]|nr:hypothetical protein [Clostridiales bacterium]